MSELSSFPLSSFPFCVANSKGSFTVDLAIILMENTGLDMCLKGLIYKRGLLVIFYCCGKVLMYSSDSCVSLL